MGVIEKPRVFISQADNFNAKFGDVLRSSAIFWARNDDKVRTTISFGNYWMYKNNTVVAVVVNVRDMAGKLISRHPISFEQSEVCNFTPPDDFEGSVEVEAFGNRNMRIPYAAIMAIYETADGISMVHSYGRAYSQHEIEDGRTISIGEESCWTVRDGEGLVSFAAFHNGAMVQPAQTATLRVRNHGGVEITAAIDLPPLQPFQTVVIEPAEHFDELARFLDGQPGNARISYQLAGAFTRMLCGVRSKDWRQLQVTHSNFDYSAHGTDTITEGNLTAYMHTPPLPSGRRQEIVVYPDTHPGNYRADFGERTVDFATGEIVDIPFSDGRARSASFRRADKILPTRIVTAMRVHGPEGVIPAECSLGVVHHARPAKSSAWMPVSQRFNSRICWADYAEVYGGCPDDATWDCSLYSAHRKEPWKALIRYGDVASKPFLMLDEMFDEFDLGEDYGYLSLRSSYGGLMFFSAMQKGESLTIEHSF